MACDVDVEALWKHVQVTVSGLREAGALPPTEDLYDSHQDTVREFLRAGDRKRAREEADKIIRENKAAAYVAYELLKEFCIACQYNEDASRCADIAAKLLRDVRKDLERQRKKRGW
jgi:hypothetical protein